MTRVDWIALAIAGLSALSGLKRGLVATALSLAGLAAGAVLGARLAPHFLNNGAASPYTPLIGLGGAVAGALLLQSVASMLGSFARGALAVIPPLKMLDSLGGLPPVRRSASRSSGSPAPSSYNSPGRRSCAPRCSSR